MILLNKREKNLLDMMCKANSVKDAVYFIRQSQDPKVKDETLTEDIAYQMLARIRDKYLDARQFINVILNYRRRSSLLRKRLTPKVPLEEEEEEEEEL